MNAALICLTVGVVAFHVKYLSTVNTIVPHQDEWTLLKGMFDALDRGAVLPWVFESRNGHFAIPSKLAYLVSLRLCSLDLRPMRLLNIPICVGALVLIGHVVRRHVAPRLSKPYLYLGFSFVFFNLCLWEHYSQAAAFTTLLGALLGSIALYFLARWLDPMAGGGAKSVVAAASFLVASVLSFGIGYAAIAAALALVLHAALARYQLIGRRDWSRFVPLAVAIIVTAVACAAHPMLHLTWPPLKHVYHFLLVLGSIWAAPFDAPAMAQNAASTVGLALLGLSLYVWVNLTTSIDDRRLVRVFGAGLVLFGIAACAAVATARVGLPDQEFLSSRYTLQPSIALAGILLYLAATRLFLLAHAWALIATGYIFATVREEQVGAYRPVVYRQIETTIRNIDSLPDAAVANALYWHEDTAAVRAVTNRFRRDHLNVFHNEL